MPMLSKSQFGLIEILKPQDELLHLIVHAFKEVGQKEITPLFLDQIKIAVQKLNEDSIRTQLRYGPVWIQKQIRNLYQK